MTNSPTSELEFDIVCHDSDVELFERLAEWVNENSTGSLVELDHSKNPKTVALTDKATSTEDLLKNWQAIAWNRSYVRITFTEDTHAVAFKLTFADELLRTMTDLNKVILPLIRRVMPSVIAQNIIGVQSMTGPSALIHKLKVNYQNSMTTTRLQAEIYTKPNCPYCVKAKALMDKHDIDYTEVSAVADREALFERVEAATGAPPKSVPQIWIGEEYIGGHDQLVVWLEKKDSAE